MNGAYKNGPERPLVINIRMDRSHDIREKQNSNGHKDKSLPSLLYKDVGRWVRQI